MRAFHQPEWAFQATVRTNKRAAPISRLMFAAPGLTRFSGEMGWRDEEGRAEGVKRSDKEEARLVAVLFAPVSVCMVDRI